MFLRLAGEFGEISTWLIGYEPNFEFRDCLGRQLSSVEMIAFFVDSLADLNSAVKSSNPQVVVLSHFLGSTSIPIFLDGRLVQPREILTGIEGEIARRGGGPYFDM